MSIRAFRACNIKLYALASVMVFTGTACSNYKNTTVDKVEVSEYVNSVEDLMNLRYYGLDEDKLNSALISEEDKSVIKSRLALPTETTDRGVFISLEEEFKAREFEEYTLQGDVGTSDLVTPDTDAITDLKITERNGERGIYTDDVYVDAEGQFRTIIYDDEIWVDVPKEVVNQRMIGTPEYKFKVVDYSYFDGGNLIVKLESDIEGAFNDRYANVEIVDSLEGVTDAERISDGLIEWDNKDKVYKITLDEYNSHLSSFYMSSSTITATLDIKIDVESGIMKDIDIGYITDALLYE